RVVDPRGPDVRVGAADAGGGRLEPLRSPAGEDELSAGALHLRGRQSSRVSAGSVHRDPHVCSSSTRFINAALINVELTLVRRVGQGQRMTAHDDPRAPLGTATEVADGVFAYIQPDGTWWINNTGFLVGRHRVTAVDACATERRTRAFLDTIRSVTPAPVR